SSRYVADALARSPESIAWLDDDADLAPRGRDRLQAEVDALLDRTSDTEEAVTLLRALRRREMARTAMAEVLALRSAPETSEALTDIADVVLGGTLRAVEREVADGEGLLTRGCVVAMGRFGGR